MSVRLQKQAHALVQLRRRTSINTWESTWQDITPYFIERTDNVTVELDDKTLQGVIEQQTTTLRFNNSTGKFNPIRSEDSLWEDEPYMMYHSMIRYYEWIGDLVYSVEDVELNVVPLIDGLIAEEPRYNLSGDCTIRVNSMLDILREHYILDGARFNYTISGQFVYKYIQDLYNDTYPDLGVTASNCLLYEEVLYVDTEKYSNNLLNTFTNIVNDSGSIGGMTRLKELFITYIGAPLVTQQEFVATPYGLDAAVGCWSFNDGHYSEFLGQWTGNTATDRSGLGNDCTVVRDAFLDGTVHYDSAWAYGGFFHSVATQNFYRVFSSALIGTGITCEILFKPLLLKSPSHQLWQEANNNLRRTIIPLLLFTDATSNDLSFIGANNSFEGWILSAGKIYYVKGNSHSSNIPTRYSIDEEIELGDFCGENIWQYITLQIDYATKTVYYYLNGKFIKSAVSTNGGTLMHNYATKMMGYGWFGTFAPTAPMYKQFANYLGNILYGGLRVSKAMINAESINNQYKSLLGNVFEK